MVPKQFGVLGFRTLALEPGPAALSAVAESPVELLLSDPQGRRLGNIEPGNDVFEIPRGSYFRDFPIGDDDGDGPSLGDPTGIKTAYVPNPLNGIYILEVRGTGAGSFTIRFSAVASDGTFQEVTVSGVTAPGSLLAYEVEYSATPGSPLTVEQMPTGPSVGLSTLALSFGEQLVGATSGAQMLTLTNSGTAGLNISDIALTGDFGQTNNCETSVAAGGSCTFGVTFSPSERGNLVGTLTISSDAEGSPHAVAFTGTGIAPRIQVAPDGYDFGKHLVGTVTSVNFALRNIGEASATITGISASGDFTLQSNGCGTSLAPSEICQLTVDFTPKATGPRTGTLTVASDAPESPQSVSLSGMGTDFSLSADPSSRTVTAGDSATYTLGVNPISGFNQAVSLSCAGAPQRATCTLSSSSVTPDGTNPASVTVTVTTTARSLAPPARPPLPPFGDPAPRGVLLWLLLGLLAALFIRRQSDPSNSHARVPAVRTALAATMLLILLWAACGGGGTTVLGPTPQTGTPAGTYTLTVTGTSSGVERTTTLTLTVN
jgi:hypothetical protein